MLHLILMLNTMNILMKKIPNLKLLIMSEYQNIKAFLIKVILKIGLKKFLLLPKLKIQFHGLMLLVIYQWRCYWKFLWKKNCKKTNQKEFRIEKFIKSKDDKLYVKWKGYDSLFNSWIHEIELYKNESILSQAV